MASDITEYREQGTALAQPSQATNLLAQIVEAARDPQVDANKMKSMAELAMQMQDREQVQQFNRDFIAACAEMPVITKSGRIEIPSKNGGPSRIQGSFAKFEDLNRIVKPILDRHNLSLTFELGDSANGRPACTPMLWHRNGYVREGKLLSAPLENSGSKNDTQAVGSTTSYLKRYTMCAALNIVVESEDDDGSGGKVLMPEERGNLVIEEAQAAFDDGRYAEWFKAQSPKDRGWLVTSGQHSRFGGAGPALPGPKPDPQQASDPPQQKSALLQRVDQYCDAVKACQTLEELQALQLEKQDWISQVREKRPDIGDQIAAANSKRFAELSGNQNDAPASGELFGGDA